LKNSLYRLLKQNKKIIKSCIPGLSKCTLNVNAVFHMTVTKTLLIPFEDKEKYVDEPGFEQCQKNKHVNLFYDAKIKANKKVK